MNLINVQCILYFYYNIYVKLFSMKVFDKLKNFLRVKREKNFIIYKIILFFVQNKT